jgi:protein TonB
MTESTARAALFELQSSKFPFYLWAVPQKPVCVRIPFPVIDRLENEAVENFRSLSSKGSEIGGLLFGNVSPGQPSEVTIEDYELISCDYSRGPLYRLADADMGRFDRSILQHGSAGSLAVVGFFRSHTRKNLSLDADDLGFFDARFRDPHQIALLIRPLATKASTAGIFIRENGIVQPDASCLEFPFRSSLLAPEPPRAEPVESKPAAPSPAPAPPAPATGRNVARGQIVPIASRREVGSAMPAPSVEPAILARTPVEPAAPASGSATARMASPAVSDPPKPPPHAPAPQSPASKLDDKVARPKPEDKTNKPQVEEKVAKPKVEDKAAAKSKPEDKAAVRPQVEDRSAAKPKVEDKVTPVKSIYTATAAAPVEEPAKARSKRLWIVLGAGALLTLVIAFFVYPPLLHRNRPSGAAQDSSQLSLRVERTAGEILLTWNRDATAIRTATHAVLSISDGDQHENVEMDLPQLRNGSISYSPASSDVVFKMEVTGHGNEKTASESVRVLRTKPLPMAPAETPQQAGQTPAKGAPAVSTPQPNTPQSNSAPSPAANPGNTAAAPATPDPEPPAPEVTQAKATKAFQAPLAQRLHPANPADLPDAPSLGRVENSSVPNVAGFNMNSVTAPVAPPKPGNPSPSAPAEKKATTGGQITQAVLVSRKDPEYPKLARETGAKGIVELLATIGIDGRVKAVKVVHGPPMLIKAASDAVLQWKYKPTILNGVAVEATTQVFVNFLGGDR